MTATKKMTVPYLQTDDEIVITAKDKEIADFFGDNGYPMKLREGVFSLVTDSLPDIPGVKYKKHHLKVPNLAERKELETAYQKYLAMEHALELMTNEVEKQRELVAQKVKKVGMKLKPSLLNDSQIFIRGTNTRLHNCVSVTKEYNVENIRKVSGKYPVLEKCFDLKRVTLDFSEMSEKDKTTLLNIVKKQNMEFSEIFNKGCFDDLQCHLPPSLLKKCVTYSSYENLREIELPNPECIHCGGKLKKDNTCRRCNLTQEID